MQTSNILATLHFELRFKHSIQETTSAEKNCPKSSHLKNIVLYLSGGLEQCQSFSSLSDSRLLSSHFAE